MDPDLQVGEEQGVKLVLFNVLPPDLVVHLPRELGDLDTAVISQAEQVAVPAFLFQPVRLHRYIAVDPVDYVGGQLVLLDLMGYLVHCHDVLPPVSLLVSLLGSGSC